MKVIKEFNPCDRYVFDFDICAISKGWAQVDTSQDASYFGTWANPKSLEVVSYTEGDIVSKKCDNKQEFIDELNSIKKWNNENGYSFAIDPGLQCDIEKEFINLGLSHLLH